MPSKDAEKRKEYSRKYYEEHREHRLEYFQQHYQIIKEKANERRRTKMECECGSIFAKGFKYLHLRTPKHQDFIAASTQNN